MATYARCGGIFNNDLLQIYQEIFQWKKIEIRLRFDRIMATSFFLHFLAHYMMKRYTIKHYEANYFIFGNTATVRPSSSSSSSSSVITQYQCHRHTAHIAACPGCVAEQAVGGRAGAATRTDRAATATPQWLHVAAARQMRHRRRRQCRLPEQEDAPAPAAAAAAGDELSPPGSC